ncbi:MAG: spore germination protein, partial [Eubacteriaceae bacterium]|nr:spore germination protein [Eubacteriaceae bacterium]
MSLFHKNKSKSNTESKNQLIKNSKDDSAKGKDTQNENNNSKLKTNKLKSTDKLPNSANEQSKEMKNNQLSNSDNEKRLSSSFEENIETIDTIFDGDDTIVKRQFQNEHGLRFYLFYSDGLINAVVLNEHIMQPLLE